MNRLPLLVAGLTLGLASLAGNVAAQESPSDTIANGGYSVADPSNPIVADEGDVRIYGEIATGNQGGEVMGDPAALSIIQSHDDIANSVPPPDLNPYDDPDPAPAPVSGPAPAPADGTTTTTTETTTGDGSTSTQSGTTGTTGTTGTSAGLSYCGSYGTWYDAQVAYETAGALGADPGLVQMVDPDYDGVACEELIVY